MNIDRDGYVVTGEVKGYTSRVCLYDCDGNKIKSVEQPKGEDIEKATIDDFRNMFFTGVTAIQNFGRNGFRIEVEYTQGRLVNEDEEKVYNIIEDNLKMLNAKIKGLSAKIQETITEMKQMDRQAKISQGETQ